VHIGITFDLRSDYVGAGFSTEEAAEFDQPETIQAIEQALQRCGYRTERIGHVQNLAARLAAGRRWDLVFNLAEGVSGYGREAQVPALLDAFGIPYTFSDPLVLALALHKGMAKHVMRALGVPTPAFALVESEADIARVTLSPPLFVKPVAEGSSKGITAANKIATAEELHTVCSQLLRTYRQPVLVETFLAGREFTVGMLGTGQQAKVLGVLEIRLRDTAEPEVYSYANKVHYRERVHYHLADDATARHAADIALRAWRGLGCRDGGRVDVRCDTAHRPYCLELNPLPGLHPHHSDLPILCGLLGIRYDTLIGHILQSARQRLRPALAGGPRQVFAGRSTGADTA
jgi:D-alanine-D-alanine ligase